MGNLRRKKEAPKLLNGPISKVRCTTTDGSDGHSLPEEIARHMEDLGPSIGPSQTT
jgi:hypothetical protein